ncbi:3-deoxy-D-arabino-heptulosonate 7-phosphate (DAHP) synthase class II/chorismate mutase [Sphingomonas kaistensis]|uniref:Phospho-2-dehydro-3-deoxyheptonate aldolase n=1 Tax=Sphingomonas kaistensis TaxID=298708 RepID=A0A7X5Y848_9SPHN|nr:3-deoxy-7-phosphoheptulonate synthase [Sphingomonas kaistensis]NJC06600.1 3-deoxy-D-arabino-heptulosonate 7-phosphate (DAHP) synthase class II/chorismate mutase [Sphingomonas kaistensis]
MNPKSQNIISPIPPVLDVLRKDIDWIDDQILDLLEQRYAVVKKVAWAKHRDAEQVLAVRPAREAAILERLSARAIHVPEADVAHIWRSILSLSAHHQRAYRVLVSGPATARAALLSLASARYSGVPVEWLDDQGKALEAAERGEAVLLVAADQASDGLRQGLELIAQHATGCVEHPWALELGRLGSDDHARDGWSPGSWQGKVHQQLPAYPEPRLAREAVQHLADSSGIVPLEEVAGLQALVADAQGGRAVVLQAGDCAERMDAAAQDVHAMVALVDRLGADLEERLGLPAIRIGRLGGQYAKPRSQAAEGEGTARMPAYRGDAVNSRSACPHGRTPDPSRLLTARDQSERVRGWLAGRSIHTSHEALLLDYEAALTRTSKGRSWATSAHSLWLGERTRDVAGAHVEYLRGIANPIGIKCGPTLEAEQLTALLDRLDPDATPGRITLVSRLGAGQVEQRLPSLMAAVRASGRPVLWVCDPMHGNNRSANGTKLRLVPEIIAETEAFVRIAHRSGVVAGGLHLEVTPQPVLECVERLDEATADRPFESLCDPRLNAEQALRVVAAYAAAVECRP